jgi:flagellar export protein FliJ
MPPKFSLQTVLDVRHSKVELLEVELGRLNQERHQKTALCEALALAMDTLYENLHEHMRGEMDLFLIGHLRNNCNNIALQIQQVQQSILVLEQAIEQKRIEVVEAKKSEESLNILKNKESDRFLEEEKDKERRFQDDIYISQGFRRQRTEV